MADNVVLKPNEKLVLMDVVRSLIDKNQSAVVETLHDRVDGNVAYVGDGPHLPAHGMEFGKNNSKHMNAEHARSVKLGDDITITFENGKYQVHTPNGTAVVSDNNYDMQTAWRLALRKYEKGVKSLRSTAYYFRDTELQDVYISAGPELEKISKFEKATNKLKNMGITKFKFMSDKQND